MSKHRQPLDPLPSDKYTRHLSIRVTCAHGLDGERTVLGHLLDMRSLTHREADLMAPDAGRDGGPLRNAPLKPYIAPDGHKTWPLRCRRCRDDWPVREENLLRVIDLLRQARCPGPGDEHLEVEIGMGRKIAARLLH